MLARQSGRATAHYPDLANKSVFVSGGATGIGEAIVRAFTGQDARVTFVDLNVAAGESLAAELGHSATFATCDVTDTAALETAIDSAATKGLDVLVNNAANDLRMPLADIGPLEWQQAVDVNLRHQFFASRRAALHMTPKAAGSIINFGSVAPQIMVPDLAVYSACKAAVRGLTRSLANDLGPAGIRVNSVVPGAVLTSKQRALWYPDQSAIDAMVARQCIPRELDGDDIAQMVLFLASDVSAACTAQEFIVDGGIS